jgi:hypothetical protein
MKKILLITSLFVLFQLNAQTVNITNADFETENLAIPTVSPGVGLGWHTNNTQNPKITGGEATTPSASFSTLRQDLNFPTAGFYSFSVDVKADASPLLKNLYVTMRNPDGNGLNPIWVLDSGTTNVNIPPNSNGNVGKNLQPLKDQVLTEYTTFSGQLIIGSDNETHRLQISNNDGTLESGQGYKIRFDNVVITFLGGLSINDKKDVPYSAFYNSDLNTLSLSSQITLGNVKVFNSLGQQVIEEFVQNNSVVLKINYLNSGIYVVTIQNEKGSNSVKFLKN